MPADSSPRADLPVSGRSAGRGSRRDGRRAAATGVLTAAAAAAALVVPASGTAAKGAAEGADCSGITVDQPRAAFASSASSKPMLELQVDRAQEELRSRGISPGGGVGVAIVDSGIAAAPGLPVAGRSRYAASAALRDAHGSIVAGLVAGAERDAGGPVGVAPDAKLYDVRVYDAEDEDPETAALTPTTLAAGLTLSADYARRGLVDVVVVALTSQDDERRSVRKALRRLLEEDVVVVAASGDRPQQETDPLYNTFGQDEGASARPGEDAAGLVWPAASPSRQVLTVNASSLSAEVDPASYVLPNTDTDVAAPTTGAVSYAMQGSTCLVPPEPSSEWSAALVGGLVALLRSAFPRENAQQIVARVQETATGAGSPESATPMTGFGIIQPLEALHRPLEPTRAGKVSHLAVTSAGSERAVPPREPPDVLAPARNRIVWWGLAGLGLLVVAVVLRPLLAGRR